MNKNEKNVTPRFIPYVIYLLVLFAVTTASADWTWQIQSIDSIGNVGVYTALSFDTTGKPYISYYDISNDNLKLAYWAGTQWNISVIDTTGSVGQYSSLGINSLNQKSVSYYDASNGALKYAGYLQLPWSWDIQTVDANGDVGQYSSLAFDVIGNPSITYYNATTADLKSANWTGSVWYNETIDTTGNVGTYSSFLIDSANQKSAAYYDATNGALKYAGYLQLPWSWDIQTVEASEDVGQYTSLAFDVLGNPSITYYNSTTDDLKSANWIGSIWYNETIDTTGDVGMYSSLVIDSANQKSVTYYDATNGALKYAGYLQLPWSWDIQTVDANGDVGQYTSLALDTADYPHISYYDAGLRNLKFCYYDDVQWHKELVDTAGDVGQYNSLTLGERFSTRDKSYPAMSRAISYYDATNGDLKFASLLSNDVMVVQILVPESLVRYDTILQPQARIRNNGLKPATFPVIFSIRNYSEIITVSLNPQAETVLTFPYWTANIIGSFFATCSTMLAGEEYRENDFIKKRISVSSGTCPEIYSISPDIGPNAGLFTINITGLRFENGVTAQLRKFSQPNIIADSSHIQFISSQEINATFNLTSAIEGVWDLRVANPNGDYYDFYQAFTVMGDTSQWIPFSQWKAISVPRQNFTEWFVSVPTGVNDVFVLLKKTLIYSHHLTWPGVITILRNGVPVASANGQIDYGIHIRNPQPGLYVVRVQNDDYFYQGVGHIRVSASLDTLNMGEWRLGRVLRGWGNDWLQLDVPSGQDTLYIQTDGFGIHSTLDIYKDSLGSTLNHWFFGEGYNILARINNPSAGRYYIKYMDSDNVVGDTGQIRDYLIRASTVSIVPPPPGLLSITSLSTYRGGTAGPVTVIVSGAGFDTSATVSLVRSGHQTVNATYVFADSTKRTLWATFDLSSATPGQWSFKVKNPSGDSALASRTFEVVSGGEPELSVEIIGRSVIRQGRPSTYIIRCENSGTVDIRYTLLRLSTLGLSNNSIKFEGLWYPADTVIPWDSMNPTVVLDGTRSADLLLLFLPPGQTAELRMRLTDYETGSFVLASDMRYTDQSNFLRIENISIEWTRKMILSDSSYSPEMRSFAADSARWWNRWCEWMVEQGQIIPDFDGSFRNVRPWTWVCKGFDIIGFFVRIPCPVIDAIWFWYGIHSFLQHQFRLWREYNGETTQQPVKSTSSSTPEDKYGPVGFDMPGTPSNSLKRFVQADEVFPYRIDFWNHESASAPAQEVFVKDTLSTDFVDSTFNFTEFGFLRWTVPLSGGNYFNTYVDMRPDDSLIVNVEGTYDPNSREISWTFHSLDPITMQPPEDPMAGFLPPIDSTGYQIGWVNFTAQPRVNLQTGHKITNQSWVKFDVGAWKPAPESGPYLNTIDAGRPSSQVRLIPDTTASGEFIVKWAGQDDSLGSGIRSYNIYVKTDNGPYRLWLSNTTDTMATFVGRNESRHYFYSIATDNVGWVESAPDSFDACTFVNGIASPVYRTPQDYSIVTDATPTFVWSATASAQGNYTLQYSFDSSFVQGVTTISGLTDTTYTVPDTFALVDSLYFWRAEAISRLTVHSGYRRAFRFILDANAPVPPILLSPQNNSITTDSTPSFIWSETAGDSGRYLLQFAADSSFDSLKGAALTYDTIYNVPNSYPLPDTTYYWRVRAIDRANNHSGWSLAWRFEIDTRIPIAPILVTPIQGVWQNDTSVIFSWTQVSFGKDNNDTNKKRFFADAQNDKTEYLSLAEAVKSSVRYIIQVDSNYNFITPLFIDTTSTTYNTANLSERKYFWRVRGYDLAGNQGIFSNADSFGIDLTAPSIPILISPTNNAMTNDSNVTFVWNHALDNLSGVARYTLEYATDSGFTNSTDTIISDTVCIITLIDSTYYWHIKAHDRAGNQSSWSTSRCFELDTRIPNAPTLISPINGIWLTNTTVIFHWSQVTFEKVKHEPQISVIYTDNNVALSKPEGLPYKESSEFASAVRYIIQIDTNRNFILPLFIDTTSATCDTFNLSERKYYWRIRAYDLAGNQGTFSGQDSFGIDNTAPNVPNLISPASNAMLNTANVTFIWNRSTDNLSGILRYTLECATNSVFSNPTDTIVTDTTNTLTLTDTTYYWRVKAQDRAGNQSNWSISRSFEIDTRIPNAPTLISPVNGIWFTTTSIIFSWSQVTFGAKSPVRYILEIITDTLFSRPLIDTTSLTCDTFRLSQARYFWRVRAYDLAGNQGAFSNPDSFGVDNTAPCVPNLVLPRNNAILTDSFVTFVWNHSTDIISGVRSYQLQVTNDSNFMSSIEPDTVISDTTITLLIRGTKYWRVKAIDVANNQSNWSNVWKFRVRITGIEEITTLAIPTIFSLSLNSPNPFNSQTAIRYSIPRECNVSVSIYDVSGKLVKILINETMNAGFYSVSWNGTDNDGRKVGQGVYFYVLKTAGEKIQKKMLMLR